MHPLLEHSVQLSRRHFFSRAAGGLGIAALASLLEGEAAAVGAVLPADSGSGGLAGLPHFRPRAKRVIYLFQSGAPSQLDLFDYKPRLTDSQGSELPDSVRMGQRLTGMTARQTSFPVAASKYRFEQHGQCG